MAFAFEKLVAYQKSGDFADEICTRTELTPTVTIGEVFTRFLAWTEKIGSQSLRMVSPFPV